MLMRSYWGDVGYIRQLEIDIDTLFHTNLLEMVHQIDRNYRADVFT